MPSGMTKGEERALRDMGRRALESAAKAGADLVPPGLSRTFAKVVKINADGTLDVDMGSSSVPMPITGIAKTTACATVRTGDVVVLDTYAHVSVATGVIDGGQGLIPDGYITLAMAASDLLRECSLKSRSSISNLINYPGVFTWSPSSSNKPVADSYGVLMCFGNFGGTNSQWYMQVAMPTSGNDMYFRRSVNSNASSWTAWVKLSGDYPPKNHAWSGTASQNPYGIGNSGKYGHVALSDSTSSGNGVNNGFAATPAAVKAVKDSLTTTQNKVSNISKIYRGSKVLQVKNDSSGVLFTAAQLKSQFGGFSPADGHVFLATNGDGNVESAHIQNTTYKGGNVYALFDRVLSNNVRVNWVLIK